MNPHDLARQLPLRLTAGTHVLDSGLRKRDPDEETAKHRHGFAVAAEMLIGAALVITVVPARLALTKDSWLVAIGAPAVPGHHR